MEGRPLVGRGKAHRTGATARRHGRFSRALKVNNHVGDQGLKGEGQIIGVADSGIDWDQMSAFTTLNTRKSNTRTKANQPT